MNRSIHTIGALLSGAVVSLAAPANDDFASAQSLGSAWTAGAPGSLLDATSQGPAGEPDLSEWARWGWQDDLTVWYEWTAPVTAAWAQVSTAGTNLTTRLAVYTGSALDSLTRVRLNERRELTDPNRTTFPVTEGTKYFIRVSSDGSMLWHAPWFDEMEHGFSLSLKAIAHPATADGYVLRGRGRLELGTPAALVQARDDFAHAMGQDSNHEEARFLLGLAQLFALEGETAFSTLLGKLGIPVSGSFRGGGYDIPLDFEGRPIFAEGADSQMILDWLRDEVLPRLGSVRFAMNGIAGIGFRTDLTESEAGGEFAVDTGDALAIKAATHAVEMLIHLLTTYNLSVPLEGLAELDREGELSAERVLEVYQSLLEFSGTDRRAQLASSLEAVESQYRMASDFIRQYRDSDPGLLTDALSEDPEFDDGIRSRLAQAVEALNQETEINGRRVNLSAFLNSTASLRDWLPDLQGHRVTGSFPDPTFGGGFPDNTRTKMENRLYELGRLWGMSQYAAEAGEWLGFLGLADRPGDDADGDGRSNFTEWVFGTDPMGADTVYQEVIPPADAGGEVKFSFIRAANLQDWRLVVLVSDDMLTWDDTEVGVEPVGGPVPNGDGISETVTYRLIAPDGLPSKKFFRVEARPKP